MDAKARNFLFFMMAASVAGLAGWSLLGKRSAIQETRLKKTPPKDAELRLPPASASPAPSPQPLSPEAFREFSAELLASLPKTQEIRRLPPEEVHHSPTAIREGGYAVGRLKRVAKENPSLVPQVLASYRECALMRDVAPPLRALCAANWRDLSGASLDAPELREVPTSVKALARRIPSD